MVRNTRAMQAKAKLHKIAQRQDDHGPVHIWDIKSPSGGEYIVWAKRNKDMACNCAWGTRNYHTNRVCSHIIAVKTYSNNWQHAELTSYWGDDESAKRQHRRTERFQDVLMTTRAAA